MIFTQQLRISLVTLLVFISFLFSCQSSSTEDETATSSPPASSNQPNVVLIVADDHGTDALGCYGNPVIQTPHLDALAADGIRFTRAFCTTASCSASRSVILTGLHNHANGHYGHEHSYHHFSAFDTIKSLPVLLREQGYRTARIGKYHVAPEAAFHFDEALPDNSGNRNTVKMAERCKDFITASNRPFFLYFCSSDPHRGGGFAEELPEQPDRFGNRPEGYEGVEPVTYEPSEVLVPPFLPDNAATRAEIAQYYEAVSRLDQGVGRLVELLKEAGKYENTLILYISDNGMAFPGAKTNLYEPGMRLPLIVKLPHQNQAGTVSDYMVSWVDLTPTLLTAAGGGQADYFHGKSFTPAWEDPQADGSLPIYASHTFHEITMYYPMRVIRDEQYKLIMNIAHRLEYPFASDLYASKTWQSIRNDANAPLGQRSKRAYLFRPEFELYDIQRDSLELHNLAQQAQYQEVLAEMQRELQVFQQQTQDPWLYKWEYE